MTQNSVGKSSSPEHAPEWSLCLMGFLTNSFFCGSKICLNPSRGSHVIIMSGSTFPHLCLFPHFALVFFFFLLIVFLTSFSLYLFWFVCELFVFPIRMWTPRDQGIDFVHYYMSSDWNGAQHMSGIQETLLNK